MIYRTMKIQSKRTLSTIFVFLIFVVCAVAQGPPVPPIGGDPDPPYTPIDDGLILLFAAALIYGVYRIVMLSKKQAQA